MAIANIINMEGNTISTIDLKDEIFNIQIENHVLHNVVRMQLTNKRSGTRKVKNRSDVKGSGRKLFRQKGTGNARVGDIKSPIRRGGGVIFGPQQKEYNIKVNKKVKKLALKMALSSKLKEDNIVIMDNFELDEIKTKKAAEILNRIKCADALVIIDQDNEKIQKSSKNLPKVKMMRSEGLNVYDILKYKKLLILEPAVEKIYKRLEA